MDNDITGELQEQVVKAYSDRTPLAISAGCSKTFYGNEVEGAKLDLGAHTGIIDYRASELVITARSGTKLSDIESALAEQDQQLAFEPPRHTADSTIGGVIACGLSGPARAFHGAARDFVLGTKIINGKGEVLRFGGQVMKNVAGYDVSRLMVGAQGTLGVLLEVSLKVLPRADAEITAAFDAPADEAHRMLRAWLAAGHPITASSHYRDRLTVRLSSTRNSVDEAHRAMGGETVTDDIWAQLRDQTHPWFDQRGLWRLSMPPAAAIDTGTEQLIEWGGALRWQVSGDPLFDMAQGSGGHATRYRMQPGGPDDIFHPLQPGIAALHKRIKQALDPSNILNPGRLYREL